MKLLLIHTIALVSGVAAIAAASALAACSSSSSGGTTPGTDSGTTADAPTTGMDGGTLSCSSYCATIAANCTGANSQYIDNATCLGMCANLPVGTTADMAGDTLGCRTYHAGAAASNATLHCPHAGPTGAALCSTSVCQAFCELDLAQCKAGMAAYPDQPT
jgi:hypothetical protein